MIHADDFYCFIALSGAKIDFFCCGGYWEHHHRVEMISNPPLTVTKSRMWVRKALWWFYRPMKTMFLSLHFLPVLLAFTEWLPVIPILVSSWAQSRRLFIYRRIVTLTSSYTTRRKIAAFYEDFFSFLFQRWRKWCEWGCPRLSRGLGSWKNASKVTSPHSGSSNTHLSLFNFHFETISKPMICVYFLLNSNDLCERDSLCQNSCLGHSRYFISPGGIF